MAHNTPITTANETLEEILSNGKQYTVPKFQRDYSWEQEQWEVLWEDIHGIVESEEYHYMGYLVLQQGKEQAIAYIKTLEEYSGIYGGLFDYENDVWRDFPNFIQIKESIRVLNLFGIKQPMSLLLAAYKQYGKQEFSKILHWIVVFSVRYNAICHLHSNEQERLYNNICKRIHDGCEISEIKAMIMHGLYPNDEVFINAFREKAFPTEQSHKKARYILCALSRHMGDLALDEKDLSVEHILPQNAHDDWQEYFGDHWKNFTQRLGNMALVSQSTNKQLGQQSFEKKQAILAEANICKLNASIDDYPEWSTETISSRQNKMAEVAKNTWRIS